MSTVFTSNEGLDDTAWNIVLGGGCLKTSKLLMVEGKTQRTESCTVKELFQHHIILIWVINYRNFKASKWQNSTRLP